MNTYLLFKSLHLIAVISWMAGLLYLPRIFVYHFYLGSILLSFNNDNNTKSSKFFRWLNEFPTLLLIIIVFVVIFKPM